MILESHIHGSPWGKHALIAPRSWGNDHLTYIRMCFNLVDETSLLKTFSAQCGRCISQCTHTHAGDLMGWSLRTAPYPPQEEVEVVGVLVAVNNAVSRASSTTVFMLMDVMKLQDYIPGVPRLSRSLRILIRSELSSAASWIEGLLTQLEIHQS